MANVVTMTVRQRKEVVKRVLALQYRYGLNRKELSEVTGINLRSLVRARAGREGLSPKTLRKLKEAEETSEAGVTRAEFMGRLGRGRGLERVPR